MGIFRVSKNNDFVVMDKTSLRDDRLSWKAKGLHAYMLSMPDDWTFYDNELSNHARDGKDALKSAIKELSAHGYMSRQRVRLEDGTFRYETTVTEKPVPVKPATENPVTDNPPTEKPLTDNPQLLNNDVPNNELLNNNLPEEKEEGPAHFESITLFENQFGRLSPHIQESILAWIDDFEDGDAVVKLAMEQALEMNVRNWKYVNNTLRDWAKKKARNVSDAKALIQEFESKKEAANNAKHSGQSGSGYGKGQSYAEAKRELESAEQAWR